MTISYVLFYVVVFVLFVCIALLLCEFISRKLISGFSGGVISRKISAFQNMPYDYHPYLSFVYKPNGYIPEDQSKVSLLNREKGITTYGVPLNSLGFCDGPHGDRDVSVARPTDVSLRICCVGESTTAAYINCDDKLYSYPNELEKILCRETALGRAEVINFGHGSWTSAEILINYMLRVCDYEPDFVVALFGYNDIPISLSPHFRPDYGHAKINIYKYQDVIRRAADGFASRSHFVKLLTFWWARSLTNIANDIGIFTNLGKPDYSTPLVNLNVFRRNLENLVAICETRGARPVLVTYPYYENRFNRHIKSALVHKRGLDVVNDHIRQVASNSSGILVDAAIDFPIHERNFLDSMHYSDMGVVALAELIHSRIKAFIKT